MKLTLLLLTIACMQVSAETFSQGSISLNMKAAEIKKVLMAIEKKSEYRFLFDEDVVKGKPRINISVEDANINDVLGRLFSNTGISYRILNTNLVVLKETDSPGKIDVREVTVSGLVTNLNGQPIEGVSISVKGTSVGTTTDANGAYSLTVPDNATLVYSSIGFIEREEVVGNRTSINVQLVASERTMDEVVVVGYGSLRRSQIVGSVAKVSGTEITKQPVLTAAQGLQGKASGIQVIASGDPGSQPQVRIRGTNTVQGNANPVYIVDGVITDNIVGINNADIESIEVLKDAASQAIYGSRAANGVILITTKRGKAGKMRIELNSFVGVKSMTSKVKMADALTYAQFTNEARQYDNQAPMFPDLNALEYDTDWFGESIQNGMIQNHSVALSGGTDKTTYYFSAGYFEDEGIVRNENFKRLNFRLNNNYKVASFLEFGHNLNLSVTRGFNKPNPFNDAYRNAPTTPVRFPNGDYGLLVGLSVANPVKANEQVHSTSNGARIQGDVYSVLKPIKNLSIRTSFAFNRNDANGLTYNYPYTPIGSIGSDNISSLSISSGTGFYYNFDNNATYNRRFGNMHEMVATVGYSAERTRTTSQSASGDSVPVERNLWYLNRASPNSIEATSGGSLVTRASMYSRLTYTYDNKYSISGVLRRDGSSNFPTNNQWGTFYSLGASWVLTRERFMENIDWLNEMKLRMGYGRLGNDRVPGAVAALNPFPLAGFYSFGGDAFPLVGAQTFNQIRDASVSWEVTNGVDVGLEFTALNRRLTGEVAYYNKLSNVYIPVTLVALAGDNDNSVYSKAADVRNDGVELGLRWQDNAGRDFRYHVGFNITFNRNNVENVNGSLLLRGGSLGNGEIVTYTVEGREIGSFWVYDAIGIFENQAQVDATPRVTGTKPGDLIFRDVNKDGIINDLDRIFVGSYQPKTYYGINAGFNWKQLDFSIDCYGNAGNKVYNGKKGIRLGNDNIEADRANDRWTPDNTTGSQPRASNAIPKPSTYFVESGSFFRVNNITVGYNLPASNWNIGMSSLRVFASAQNPIISKKYSGFTPELPGGNNGLSAGIETGIYPVSTTYMFGVNVTF